MRKAGCPYKNWKDGELPARDVFGAACCDCKETCEEFQAWFAGPKNRTGSENVTTCENCRYFIERKIERQKEDGVCLNSSSSHKYVNKMDACELGVRP